MATIKKAQLGGLIKKGVKAVEKTAPKKALTLSEKVKEAKWQKNKGKFGMTEDISWKEFKKIGKDANKGTTDINQTPKSSPVVLTAEQKANNARILKEIREGKRKNGGPVKKVVKKAKSGTSLGMKSVKAGFDKNPGVTRADIITAAKGKAKSGTKMKSGGKMTKCKYGCK
jgi:hypothetical protein